MAFERPTLTELIERDIADMSSRVNGGAGSVLRRAVLGVLARTMAGASHMMHGHLDWVSRQILPTTCDADRVQEFADVFELPEKAAAASVGTVTFTGTNGSVIAAATELRRNDDARFTTDSEVTIASGTASVTVTAVDAGEAGDTDAGIVLALVSPISGVNNSVTVAAGGIAGGRDPETVEERRARVLQRIRKPPHGGAASDYEEWALEVPGVTRVWSFPLHMGPSTVGVAFVLDGEADIFPNSAKVQEVQDYIDAPGRRPVTANVTVFAPVPNPINPTIFLTPSTPAVKAAVQAELEDMLSRESEPGATILLSHIREAVSIAAGEYDHHVTSPTDDFTNNATQMATLGTITWG